MTAGAHSASDMAGGQRREDVSQTRGRTPAQWYCLLIGATLLLAGILGFIAEATFDTPASGRDGFGDLILFEVNGWHNLVHLASGALLLAAAPRRSSAKVVALGFGLVYGLVAIIGLIDGSDVLGLIPVNGADNVLHILLSLLGIAAGLVSRADDRDLNTSTSEAYRTGTGRRIDSSDLLRDADDDTGLRGHSPVGRRSERAQAGEPTGGPTTPRRTL